MLQRSLQWRQARLGDVTASRFADVMTTPRNGHPYKVDGSRGEWKVLCGDEVVGSTYAKKAEAEATRKALITEWNANNWSQSAESYLNELLAELIHCQPSSEWSSKATDWGNEWEDAARDACVPFVEDYFGETLSKPSGDYAYIQHPTEPGIGCSPDGLIGDWGLWEGKAPANGAKWIAAKRRKVFDVPKENVDQVQGQLWVTGRKRSVFTYFDERVKASGLDPLIVCIGERDNTYIDNVLAPKIIRFRDWVKSEYDRLVGEVVF